VDEPGGRSPAPGELRLVQAFVNSAAEEIFLEELGTPHELSTWLAVHGLAARGMALDEDDRRWAIDVREALRDLALANNGATLSRDARDVLDLAADRAGLTLRHGTGSSRLVASANGLDGSIGRLLAIVHASATDGTWARVKACRMHSCRWLFYDRSKNRSSAWCSMSICGSREKARAYRARRAEAPS
jgi:predicted RNA-binding Zn ribbon-like protein